MSRKNNKYSGEFKQEVVEFMLENHVGHKVARRHFELPNESQPHRWMKIYREKGMAALYEDRRGKSAKHGKSTGRPLSFKPKPNETMEDELKRLRAENDYLKKLQALIQQQ